MLQSFPFGQPLLERIVEFSFGQPLTESGSRMQEPVLPWRAPLAPLPSLAEQGLCVAATFLLAATNGRDGGRRKVQVITATRDLAHALCAACDNLARLDIFVCHQFYIVLEGSCRL